MVNRIKKIMIVNRKGLTLIEMLVAVAILGIVAIIGSNMFFTILKGATKTRVLNEVKQNGNYALSVMKRMIRNAKSAECLAANRIEIISPDRLPTNFVCSDEGKIASASSHGGDLTSDQVSVSDCIFSCAGSSPEVVTISFTLSQATGTRAEEMVTLNFKTTVSLRTY